MYSVRRRVLRGPGVWGIGFWVGGESGGGNGAVAMVGEGRDERGGRWVEGLESRDCWVELLG